MGQLKTEIEKKLKISFKKNSKVDPFKYFFGKNINSIPSSSLDTQWEGYGEHNFSGLHSGSNSEACRVITNYILKKFPNLKTHCDVGGSIGEMSKQLMDTGKGPFGILKLLDSKPKIESYVIEGVDFGISKNIMRIPNERVAIFDFTSMSIKDLDLEKYFDLTTAIEVTEHIPENKIKMFYDNVSYISKYHLCSAHHGGLDHDKYSISNHYLVKPIKWWINFLSKYGTVKKVKLNISGFDESEFLLVKFK